MAINEQEARAIAFIAARCRPTGAKAWDEAGIVANLRKVPHINLAELTMATIRAAANRQVDSPGVIPNLTGEHWREKVAERGTWKPPKKSEECPKHPGQWPSACGPCATEQTAAYYDAPSAPMSQAEALAAAREALGRVSA